MFADILRKNHSILTDGMVVLNYCSKLNETSKYIIVRILF